MKQPKQKSSLAARLSQNEQWVSRTIVVCVVLAFAGIGAYMLSASHAATPTASLEAESGTVSSTASIVPDSTASSASAVKFGQSAGSCPSGVINDVGGADPWGGCWPSASTTGSSGTLTASGSIDVTQDNTVIQNLRVTGIITVEAKNVTIRNVTVNNPGGGTAITVNGYNFPGSSLTVSHVTVTCAGASTGGTTGIEADSNGSAGAVSLTVDHANVSLCENGFDVDENFTITDSYVHDLANTSDSHTDGIQSSKSNNFDVEHNVIYSMKSGSPAPDTDINNGDWTTSAMINAPGGSNGLFQHNLIAGGAYTYYCVRSGVVNQKTLNNLFSTKYRSTVGAFGPTADCGVSGNTFTGNQYVAPGQAPSGSVPTG